MVRSISARHAKAGGRRLSVSRGKSAAGKPVRRGGHKAPQQLLEVAVCDLNEFEKRIVREVRSGFESCL
jgi:hypothetical protein